MFTPSPPLCSITRLNLLLAVFPPADGCFFASSEKETFSMESEAIILSFPMFMRVLEVRKIAPKEAKYSITKDNETEGVSYHGEGRVQQHDTQLWFLPAQASDSGKYTCTYRWASKLSLPRFTFYNVSFPLTWIHTHFSRNATYCVTGTITLQVYTSASVDTKNLSYPISASLGGNLKFSCPDLSEFNHTDGQIEWYKVRGKHSLLHLNL